MLKSNLPWYARFLISGFTESYDSYFLWGDIEEVFEQKKESLGILSAHLWLIFQLIKSIPPLIADNIIWSLSMFKNYLKVAYRNIIRNKIYSFINITGLAIGLVCCILIYMFVEYELSFDKHHTNYENIYRVVRQYEAGGKTIYDSGAQLPMAEALRNDVPDFLAVTNIYYSYEIQVKVKEDVFIENFVVFTDNHITDVFDLEFLIGDKESALLDKSSAIITKSIAEKYFGKKSPLGETIVIDNLMQYKVAGVIKDTPQNTNLPINIMLPVETLTEDFLGMNLNRWNISSSSNNVFVLLPENISPLSLDTQFEEMKKKYLSEQKREIENYNLQPLSDMHYNSNYETYLYTMSKDTIYIFLGVGIIILLIAGVNYVNLSTAQAFKRAKEVGMRKVLGAHRKQLVRQFIGETTLFTTLAFLIAISVSELCVGFVNDFLGNATSLSLLGNTSLFLPLPIIYLAAILLAGFYPSFVLSAFSPSQAFKNKITSRVGKNSFSLRNSLVGFQFVVSQVLIICTIVVSTQMDYFRNKDLGFRKDEIVSTPISDRDYNKKRAFVNSLYDVPSIENVTMSIGTPTANSTVGTRFSRPGMEEDLIPVQLKVADYNYSKVFDLKLIAGKFYKKHVEGDTIKTWVVNESLVNKAGFVSAAQAVGKFIKVSRHRGQIIGVVKDFHSSSLHEEITPLIFTNQFEQFYSTISIRYNPVRTKETIKAIEERWKEFFPEYAFNHEFYDEYLHQLYETEDRLFSIIKVFTGLAIFIGCLGLLGLISFTVVQKTKEIGVRKVLGASSGNIMLIISKEFIKNGIVACIVSWPIAFYYMNEWLESFAYRIELSWWMFAAAGVIGLVIILISVSYQSLKAALSNPINSIRYE
jgi:putative ABC transport system permease protein